jgi:hypothetical protein
MVESFPSNSNQRPSPDDEKVVEPTKKVEKVIEGNVVRRKKPLGKRFAETFIGGSAKSVFGYILFEVLVPAAKDTIADVVTQGIERTLYGEGRSSSRRHGGGYRSGSSSYVSYDRYSSPSRNANPRDRDRDRDEPRMSQRGRANFNFEEIVLDTREDANEVIDQLFLLIDKFEKATVADLYDLTGVDPTHTDYNWGWRDLRGARATRVRNGYLLDLPEPQHLRNSK